MASKGAAKSPAKQRGAKGIILSSVLLLFFISLNINISTRSVTFITIAIERPGLSEEEIEEIREAFNLFDADGSGKLIKLRLTKYRLN